AYAVVDLFRLAVPEPSDHGPWEFEPSAWVQYTCLHGYHARAGRRPTVTRGKRRNGQRNKPGSVRSKQADEDPLCYGLPGDRMLALPPWRRLRSQRSQVPTLSGAFQGKVRSRIELGAGY